MPSLNSCDSRTSRGFPMISALWWPHACVTLPALYQVGLWDQLSMVEGGWLVASEARSLETLEFLPCSLLDHSSQGKPAATLRCSSITVEKAHEPRSWGLQSTDSKKLTLTPNSWLRGLESSSSSFRLKELPSGLQMTITLARVWSAAY